MLDSTQIIHLDAAREGFFTDPRPVHDMLRGIASDLERRNAQVPSELRRVLEDLEAEILEDFYDNMPV